MPKDRHLHIQAHLKAIPLEELPTSVLDTLHSYEARAQAAPMQTYTSVIMSLFSRSHPSHEPKHGISPRALRCTSQPRCPLIHAHPCLCLPNFICPLLQAGEYQWLEHITPSSWCVWGQERRCKWMRHFDSRDRCWIWIRMQRESRTIDLIGRCFVRWRVQRGLGIWVGQGGYWQSWWEHGKWRILMRRWTLGWMRRLWCISSRCTWHIGHRFKAPLVQEDTNEGVKERFRNYGWVDV